MDSAWPLRAIAGLIATFGLSLIVCTLSVSADVTYEVLFSGSTTGYATYNAVNDPTPSWFVFANGGNSWDATDDITQSLDTFWVDGVPVAFIAARVIDTSSGIPLFFNLFGVYFVGEGEIDGELFIRGHSSPLTIRDWNGNPLEF